MDNFNRLLGLGMAGSGAGDGPIYYEKREFVKSTRIFLLNGFCLA